jgi:DNA-binding CsgD family transcriptional regulator
LTAREREVLDLLVKGKLYKEIAAALGIGLTTVDSHIRKIYEKLQVNSRAQVVARYVKTQGR